MSILQKSASEWNKRINEEVVRGMKKGATRNAANLIVVRKIVRSSHE